MKRAKKFLAMMLSITMVMGMSVTAFATSASPTPEPGADQVYGTADDRGTITVQGIKKEDGVLVTAYKIISANYGNDGSFSGYTSLYSDLISAPADGADLNQNLNTVSSSNLSSIYTRILNDQTTRNQGISMSLTGDGDNGIATAAVEMGSYLVAITGSDTIVYSPVIASVYYVNPDHKGNIVSGGNVNISEKNVWVKRSDRPYVQKTISTNEKSEGHGNSVSVGSIVTYTVTVAPIPYYGGNYPKLNLTDTLSEGLDYVNYSLTVKIKDNDETDVSTLTQGQQYTLDVANRSVTVDFVVGGDYKLNDYVGKKAVITYQARLNQRAAVNGADNNNDVVMNYSKDSKISGNEIISNNEDKTYTYTFDIDGSLSSDFLKKTGVGEDGNGLNGAYFTLYTQDPSNYQGDKKDIIYKTTASGNYPEGCVVSTGDADYGSGLKGRLKIQGLSAGIYYLQETEAPDGYTLNTHVYKIEITVTYKTSENDKGKIDTWKIKIDNDETNSFSTTNLPSNIQTTDIKNTKISVLPSTGGIGTTIFTIIGCLIMIVAAALFFANRKKQSEK